MNAASIVFGVLVGFGPPAPSAGPDEPAHGPSRASLPADVAPIQARIGAKKFEQLAVAADRYLEQLSRVISSWDRRGIKLNPKRPPKILAKRLDEYLQTHVDATGVPDATGPEVSSEMLAICRWRLDLQHGQIDTELRRAKGGVAKLKHVLADLRARSVESNGRYPVRTAYVELDGAGELVNVQETYEDAAAMKAGMARVERALPRVADYARGRLEARNENERTRETVDASLVAMIAHRVEATASR